MNYTQIMRFYFLVCFCLSANASQMLPVPKEFSKALHVVESGSRIGPIKGDYNKKTGKYLALGPLQIHRANFQDAQQYNPVLLKYKYEDVARLDVSILVLQSWLNRYAKKEIKSNNFEVMARKWNGGTRGERLESTLIYWEKVKKHGKF